MKLFSILSLGLALSLFAAGNARAFSSAESGDVNQGFVDAETRSVKKATADGYSDAISKGMALFFEDGSGGVTGLKTVSRVYSGTDNTALATRLAEACIASRDVATGDEGSFACVNRGYVDYAYYAAVTFHAPITKGGYLCISDAATSKGYLVPCASGVTSKFIALEDKSTTGTGSNLKVKILGSP